MPSPGALALLQLPTLHRPQVPPATYDPHPLLMFPTGHPQQPRLLAINAAARGVGAEPWLAPLTRGDGDRGVAWRNQGAGGDGSASATEVKLSVFAVPPPPLMSRMTMARQPSGLSASATGGSAMEFPAAAASGTAIEGAEGSSRRSGAEATASRAGFQVVVPGMIPESEEAGGAGGGTPRSQSRVEVEAEGGLLLLASLMRCHGGGGRHGGGGEGRPLVSASDGGNAADPDAPASPVGGKVRGVGRGGQEFPGDKPLHGSLTGSAPIPHHQSAISLKGSVISGLGQSQRRSRKQPRPLTCG